MTSCYTDLKYRKTIIFCFIFLNLYITQEIKDCIMSLYIGAVVFFIVGIYLYEIIPKEYGTQKRVLFFLDLFKKNKKV